MTKGVIRGLYSAPWNLKNPSPISYMHIHVSHSVCICIMTRCTKNIGISNCRSNRKSAILIQISHFTPIVIHFHAPYFHKLPLQIEHLRLPIHSVSSSNLEHENISEAFACVKHGGCHGATDFHASRSSIKSL